MAQHMGVPCRTFKVALTPVAAVVLDAKNGGHKARFARVFCTKHIL